MTEKYNIICFSNQLWNFPNWTNKRHVMWRLSKLGHRVLFVDPPINTGRLFSRQLISKEWPIERVLTSQYKEDEVLVYSPLDLLPFPSVTSSLHSRKINGITKNYFDTSMKTILWVYHVEIPQLRTYLDTLNYDLLIYDCVDNYAGFPKYNTPKKKLWIAEREKYLATKADLVFTTTPRLFEKHKQHNKSVFYTPNVGDYEMFKDVKNLKEQIPEDLQEIPRPRIGFIGALDEYKFDAELLRKAALDHPNYSFVLIGQIALKDKIAGLEEIGLKDLPNVYHLGTRPYMRKKYYMAGFDAELIPYQLNDYTVGGCFPVKFHDSLAAGLPVIVTNLPAYAPFRDVCYISKNYDDFSENIRRALDEDSPQRIKERQLVAKENSWEGKVSSMLNFVDTCIKEKV